MTGCNGSRASVQVIRKRSWAWHQTTHRTPRAAAPPKAGTKASAGPCSQQPLRGAQRAYALQHPPTAFAAQPPVEVLPQGCAWPFGMSPMECERRQSLAKSEMDWRRRGEVIGTALPPALRRSHRHRSCPVGFHSIPERWPKVPLPGKQILVVGHTLWVFAEQCLHSWPERRHVCLNRDVKVLER